MPLPEMPRITYRPGGLSIAVARMFEETMQAAMLGAYGAGLRGEREVTTPALVFDADTDAAVVNELKEHVRQAAEAAWHAGAADREAGIA